jgi:hypothetical protein
MQSQQLSTLMRLSWKIQHMKKMSRSKSLASAWVIYQQADIMVYYLVKKHSPRQRTTETIYKNLKLIF